MTTTDLRERILAWIDERLADYDGYPGKSFPAVLRTLRGEVERHEQYSKWARDFCAACVEGGWPCEALTRIASHLGVDS